MHVQADHQCESINSIVLRSRTSTTHIFGRVSEAFANLSPFHAIIWPYEAGDPSVHSTDVAATTCMFWFAYDSCVHACVRVFVCAINVRKAHEFIMHTCFCFILFVVSAIQMRPFLAQYGPK